MKCIVYSLFGAGRQQPENCFSFHSYLRGLMLNIRMNRLIFPDWQIYLQTDKDTFETWGDLFTRLHIKIEVHQNDVPLTLAMLWRLRPVFEMEGGKWKYSHVLCRDLDSPATYREAQAVQYWMNRDKAMHAITDSVSHTIPLLGGMIGIRPAYFIDRMGVQTWKQLIDLKNDFNWNRKGSDQSFLNQVIYPKFAEHGNDSITQHYCLGMGNTFLSDWSNSIPNIEPPIAQSLKESNDVCGHIGASGWYETAMFKFLRKYWDSFSDLIEIEKDYANIFYWVNE